MLKLLSLETENKTFLEIMSNGKRYVIPRFQRDYAWESLQLEELWEDIERMRASERQHFMGYLVLQSNDKKHYEVIDGQQRITTITLIITAALSLLEKMAQSGNDSASKQRLEHYRDSYLFILDTVSLHATAKLELNRHNKSHFQDIISNYNVPKKRGITKTNRNLNTALGFFQEKLTAENPSSPALARFIDTLVDGLLFTTITVEDDVNAYIVFETLNARGVHLSASDLLKNYLLSVMAKNDTASEDDFGRFEEDWEEVINQLGETNFTGFLRSYHGMREKLTQKKNLYRSVLKENIQEPERVRPYLNDIKKQAAVYAALQNPDDPFWREYDPSEYHNYVEYIRTLKLFNMKIPLTILMAAYDTFTIKEFAKVLRWISIISIRNIVCDKPTNTQEMAYNHLANGVMKRGIQSPSDLKSRLISTVYPDDMEFERAFSTMTMASKQNPKKIVYVLQNIEQHASGSGTAPDQGTLTVEHILPRNPSDEWKENFGMDTYNDAINRLGNMSLLPAKEALGQESFAEKKEKLGTTPFTINKKLADYDNWNIETLNRHQKWLAKQAKTIWRIE